MDQISKYLQILDDLAAFNGGQRITVGLNRNYIEKFLELDPRLGQIILEAKELHNRLRGSFSEVLASTERCQVEVLLAGYLNFYAPETVNPYVPLTASGPWVITTCGGVIHDSGGYGMLGLGQAPKVVMEHLSEPQVMANVMTASFEHARFREKLHQEIGHTRKTKGPVFDRIVCMNSGSEAMSVAARISDINANLQTKKGAKHEGKKIVYLSLHGSFHGRTDRPAQVSHSTREVYQKHLASFRGHENLVTVTPNDVGELRETFSKLLSQGVFVEAVFLEPVMGEGNPGVAITPEFYQVARELTLDNDAFLIIDSIQAGLRSQGVLSIVDYPGFSELAPPDMESYSKALNAGQYPLSVLSLRERASEVYKTGIYGNTMTSNPRALAVGSAVLSSITPKLRENIVTRGKEFLEQLKRLQERHPEAITEVQGTGLLFAASLNPKRYQVIGFDGTETYLRKCGIGVIHGGKNALRFTPHFAITRPELDMIIDYVERALVEGPKLVDS